MRTHRLVEGRGRLGLGRAVLLADARELRAVRAVAVLDGLRGRRREHERRFRGDLAVAREAVLVVAIGVVVALATRGVAHVHIAGAGGGRGSDSGVCDRPGLVVEGGAGEGASATELWLAMVVSGCVG